jgi:hypothetical protein
LIPVSAAVDSTWDANDVILGFRATAGTGLGSTLLVNLGSAATYRDTVSNINSIAGLGSAISSTYGSTWYDRTDLWAGFVSATNGINSDNSGGSAISSQTTDYNSTVYVSSRRGAAGTLGSANSVVAPGGDGIALDPQTPGGLISVLRGTAASYDNSGSDSNATAGIVIIGASTTNSWNTYVSGSSNNDFGMFNIESAFTNGLKYSTPFGGVSNVEQAWDFYRVAKFPESDPDSGFGTFQGTFTLDQSGNVDFIVTSAAVPEPSTYAMALVATVTAGIIAIRRKKQKLTA